VEPVAEPTTDEQATVLPSAVPARDETFMWPEAEKKAGRRINPLLVAIALVVVGIAVGAAVLLSGGKKKHQATPTTTTPAATSTAPQTTPKPTPHAAMPQAKRVAFLAQGRNVVARIVFADAKVGSGDVKVADANMSDGNGVVTIRQHGVMSDVSTSAGRGVKLALAAAGNTLTITATVAADKFTKLTAKPGATGKAVALTFTRKPKPKPVVHNPQPPAVSPPPVVSPPPPPVAHNPPPPVVHNPPPPPPPPPATTIIGG
jgi:hypothetical protein